MKTRVLRVGLGGISLVLLAVAAWAYMDQLANGAVTRAWLRQYNSVVSNSLDVVTAILRDPSGNIIVAGNTDDGFAGGNMVLLKYSGVDGSLLWHRRLSGPTNSYGAIAGAAVDAHGNIAITGYSYNGQDRDYYTAKFSTEGTLLWARSYDGPSDDVAMAVSFDRNGNVVVTGGSSQDEWRNDDDDLTRLDYYTAKYAAADGALLWERRYNGPGDNRDQARAIAIDANNNVVVTGYSDGESNRDQYTAKYAASDGALLWEGRRAGFGSGNALAFDASGNVIVAGTSQDDAHAVKYLGVDGTLLWEQRRDGPTGYRDALGAVAVDQSGNVIVTGYLSGNDFYLDAYTAKYAASDGAVLWEQLYNSPANNSDAGQSVAVDRAGNVIVQGYSFDSPGWYWNQFTAKYAAADGAVLWQRLQDGPRNTQGLMAALVLDGADNVVVLGSFGAGYDPDISTAKLAGTDGSMLWEQRYNGPAHRAGMGEAVAIDAHGNVFVTGHSEGDDTAMDYLTVKYAPNGTMLWERRHNGPRNGSDAPRGGLVLDPEGNAIVSGGSSGDFYTVKYAASDGAVLWEQRYNGPGNRDDAAQALAVDRDGSVCVTGFSHRNSAGESDFYTAKYAGSNGALQWERRFSPPMGRAAPDGIAVDASGNVVVTGSVWTGPSNRSDIYTVKYAAADGRTVWERQYNSPNNGYDEAVAVAMDGEGNVLVSGRSDDGYLVKYAGATGEVIWEQHHDRGWPWALTVDADGNAIVTSGNTYTAKYAAGNGGLIWERNIDDSPNQTTFTRAITVDATGNVFLGGMFYNGSNYNFFTAKYAAADGAVLWRNDDDGPGNADDFVQSWRALALGPNGMVALTGSSGGFYIWPHDFTTVVYRETPGPLPQIRIATPTNGSQWLAGSGIPLVADVTDPDGIVHSVEFFGGDTSVGVSSASPWTVTWANVSAGTHNLTARAMDALGTITVSEGVTITVTNPPAGPSVNVFALDRYARERFFYYYADTASFLVHRSGSLKSDLTIHYDLAGSASNGSDYVQLPGRVTIRAGHRVALVVIVPRKDSVREGREDVRITLRPPPVGAAPYTSGKYRQATVYILD